MIRICALVPRLRRDRSRPIRARPSPARCHAARFEPLALNGRETPDQIIYARRWRQHVAQSLPSQEVRQMRQRPLWQMPTVGRIAPLAGPEAVKYDNGVAPAEMPCQPLKQHRLAHAARRVDDKWWRAITDLFQEPQRCRSLDDRAHNRESVRCWKELVFAPTPRRGRSGCFPDRPLPLCHGRERKGYPTAPLREHHLPHPSLRLPDGLRT
jgi:hypothetical protein